MKFCDAIPSFYVVSFCWCKFRWCNCIWYHRLAHTPIVWVKFLHFGPYILLFIQFKSFFHVISIFHLLISSNWISCTPQSSFLSSNQLLNICNLVPKFWNYSFSPFFGNSTYFDQNPSKLQYIYNNQYLNKLISNPFNLTPKYSFLWSKYV